MKKRGISCSCAYVLPRFRPLLARSFPPLQVGAIGSGVALAAFAFMWFGHSGDRLLHSAACILAFTSCLRCVKLFFTKFRLSPCFRSYFATYTGAGIVVKGSESPPRDIFWARYLDALLTACVTM